MVVHVHPLPPRPAGAAPGPALPERDILVNGELIAARAIAAEMQHHPAADAPAAWRAASRALVVRCLLRQAAEQAGLDAAAGEDAAIEALLAREIRLPEPDEAAGRRWLAAHPGRFGTPPWWEASHILLVADPADAAASRAARARAAALLAEVRAVPGRLPDLARRHSGCPSRERGGHLGRILQGSTVPEFEAALAGLAPGEVCPEVVASRYGMHVVQLHRHAPARAARYEEAAPAILRDLRHAAWRQAVRHFIAVLAARARIEGFAFGAEGEADADGPLVN